MTALSKLKTVHVHAWETVNVFPHYPHRIIDAGIGGFDWYAEDLKASRAFKAGIAVKIATDPANTADFLFTVMVPRTMTSEKITALIDSELHDHCAKAKLRRVGLNVLTYWQRNKFKMGGAKRPSTKRAA